ncbi:MAG: glycosyltransferase family 2 protein [Bacteroidetes bacterium]|nr:MAG: glycosyltransferase family 2 protein [Bacteroidota bacterium]
MTKVSIIMAAYNAEKYITQSIESLINQTYTDFELILIDDGSTDETKNIINHFSDNDDRIIPVFNEKNLGLTKNLNKGIALSNGEFIARMDADDISYLTRLEKQVEFLKNNPGIDLVGTASIDIDKNGMELNKRIVPETHQQIVNLLPKANPISHPTVMFRKKSFSKVNFYNVEYKTTQDYELWFRAIGAGLKFYNLQEILLQYRMDDTYIKRKSFKYRLYDFKLRLHGFKYIKLPIYRYYYALIPIMLGIVPDSLYLLLKKFDPRAA